MIGLLAGWIAGKISRGGGFGCLGNIVIGLIGSVLGGWIFTKIGIFGGGFVYSLAAATVGAVVLVMLAGAVFGIETRITADSGQRRRNSYGG